MVSDWQQVRLGEIVDFTPKRTIKKGTTAPFISMADVTENSKFITEVFEKEYTGGGSRFANGDTLFARITPCLQNGKCSKVSGMENTEIGHGSTEFIVMAAKTPEYDEDYIYYLARLPKFRAYAESRMIGSTGRQRVSWQDLEEYEFAAPPPNERKDIGSFLSSLDDKIELNRQMNETLEAMAQALFKSWFVDFAPVIDNALAAGNAIPDAFAKRAEQRKGIEKKDHSDTQNLFPDEFEFTDEMGWIPKGWAVSNVGTEFNTVGGGTPSTKNSDFWENGDISWTTPKDLSGNQSKILLNTDRKITELGLNKISSGLLPIDTVLMSSRAPVGYLALAKVPVAINQGYIALKCEKILTPEFAIQWADSAMDEIKQRAGGTTFAEISKTNFRGIPILVPSQKIIDAYSRDVKDLYNQITSRIENINTLAKLRDTLLPKLMSGELRIPDAETLVDETL